MNFVLRSYLFFAPYLNVGFMKWRVFRENGYYFFGLALLVLMVVSLLVFMSKADSFLLLNGYHARFLDSFFTLYTNVGDGLFSIGVAVILLFYRRFLLAIEIIVAFLISGALVQILKYFFPMPRPRLFLAGMRYDHFIDQVTLTGHASFPSGHSASAFALATLLSLFNSNKTRSLFYLLAATLVGYSRIYLAQHFLEDVFAGILTGVFSALVVNLVVDRNISRKGVKEGRFAGVKK
jgi:membrane-associated phospholipid phosphatase